MKYLIFILLSLVLQHTASAQPARPSTRTKNVTILSDSFRMLKLDRYRRVWVYLPKSYNSSQKRYPVLYMQDGQNLFDDATSYAGEWGIDEYLDSLQGATAREVIVVGIDNAGTDRLREYNPYNHARHGKGYGEGYANFLVKELMPFINFHFRTLKDRANTAIAGSSMGGLISQYILMRYSSEFGIAGIFSPSFSVAPAIYEYTQKRVEKMKPSVFWFYAGGKEAEGMVADMTKMKDLVTAYHAGYITSVIDPEGIHNESSWRKHFPEFFLYAFGPKQ